MRVPTLAPARDLDSVIFKLVSIHAILVQTIFYVQKVDGKWRKVPLAKVGKARTQMQARGWLNTRLQLTLKIERSDVGLA